MRRREFLIHGSVGAGVLLSGGTSVSLKEDLSGGPPERNRWDLVFDERFQASGLDTNSWGVGWGWGRNTTTSNSQVHAENVLVAGDKLHLVGSHKEDQIKTGAINTKNKVTFGPGSYLEARIKFAGREGFHNAFWAKPNSEAWPPEIDIVEQWHSNQTEEPTLHSHHHLHYSSSGVPGDNSTHQNIGTSYRPGDDVTENFHIYGVEWREDVIRHYVDSETVQVWTDETMLRAMSRGAPFYIMVSLNINSIGTADRSESWAERMVVDWVRLWTVASLERQYLWVRSRTGEPAKFAFRASGGNVRLEQTDHSHDYWVSADGTTAGGTVSRTDSLPGFWFEGEIADFNYRGPLDVFVNNDPHDPNVLIDEATPGPPLVDR